MIKKFFFFLSFFFSFFLRHFLVWYIHILIPHDLIYKMHKQYVIMYVQVRAAGMGLGRKKLFFSFLQNPPRNEFFYFLVERSAKQKRFGGSQLARPYGIVSQYVVENAQKRGSFFFLYFPSLRVVWCGVKTTRMQGFRYKAGQRENSRNSRKFFLPFFLSLLWTTFLFLS